MAELTLTGLPASDGIAIGPAYRLVPVDMTVPDRIAGPFAAEWLRFEQAQDAGRKELEELRQRLAGRVGEEHAAIFDAQQLMLDDPMLVGGIRRRLQQGLTAERAVVDTAAEVAQMLSAMLGELFAARSADVHDIGRRLVRLLLDRAPVALDELTQPAVIIAQELAPSETAGLDQALALGICTAGGGRTSHSAILARTFGIPAVVAVGDALLYKLSTGEQVILDGSSGRLVIAPDQETLEAYRQQAAQQQQKRKVLHRAAHREARMMDGRRVEVAANISDLASARQAVAEGAESVGLLHTEFLYLDEVRPPDEDHQLIIYGEIFETLGGRPVIVRTLDIGGDKPPSFLPFPKEMNPFMGWRAIRISLERTDLFRTQLRAIMRAAVGHSVRLMFPMIDDLAELAQAQKIVADVRSELQRAGLPFASDLPVGIMVETPATAVMADVLARSADFFSLGTNDLTQYTLAVDRGNAKVAGLFQPLHPAVLRLIHQTIEGAHRAGKWVGMCGELAGMPKAIPILLGLGLDELSMVPLAIPEAKDLISRLREPEVRSIAEQTLAMATQAEVDTLMSDFLATVQ
jgi:phosphoenolpyruvate-protein phosphotransferase